MRRTYYCPKCRAPFAYGARYCSNCGVSLNCVLQQMPFHPSPLPYGKDYPQQECACGNRGAILQQKSPPAEDTATPIRAEISKLLAELFDKVN